MKQDYRQYNQHREVLLDIDGWSRIEMLTAEDFEHVIKHGMPWNIRLRTPLVHSCADAQPTAEIDTHIVTFYFSGRHIGNRPLLTTN